MENRIKRLFLSASFTLSAVLFSAAAPSWAEDAKASGGNDQVIQPDLQRREIAKPKIDSQDIEAGLYAGVLSIEDFGSNAVWGGTLAYHFNEDIFIEAEYGSSEGNETSFEKLSGSAQLLSSDDRQYTYYGFSVGWNILPGEVFFGEIRVSVGLLFDRRHGRH